MQGLHAGTSGNDVRVVLWGHLLCWVFILVGFDPRTPE